MSDIYTPRNGQHVQVVSRYIQGQPVDGVQTFAPVTGLDLGGGAGDAFGRLRVSSPQVLFDGKSIHDAQPLLFSERETGSGTSSNHSAARASVTLSVSDATTGNRVRQSKRRLAYQPGKSQLAFLTFVLGAAASGITRRVGLYDDDNGVFLEQTENDVAWVIRSSASGSAVDGERVAQADWNISTADDLDLSKSQIAVIDYEWLGVGSVRVGFVIDGAIRYVHAFHHANSLDVVYTSTPNYPVRWEIDNDGTGGAASLEAVCASVISEGGQESNGFQRAVDRAATPLTTGNDTNLYPLIALSLQSGKLGATIRALDLSVFTPDAVVFRWALIVNPTVAGTALSFSNLANSAIAYDVARTSATTVTGGTVIASGYAEATNQQSVVTGGPTDYALGASAADVSDTLVLAVQRLTGTTPSFYGTVTLLESV